MASKFFNKPQLGSANLSQAAQTNETGVDNNANAQAQQANQSVDFLLNMAGSATKIYGKYQQNLEAKDRLESSKEIPFYTNLMAQELEATEDLDSMGREGLNNKFNEVTEKFMDRYKDKSYNKQLRGDIEGMRSQVLAQMIGKRDALHVQKVGNATSERANDLGQQFAAGSIDADSLRGLMSNLMTESTLAHQVGSSTELDLPDEMRESYQGLTKKQAQESILKGMMINTGQPQNSKVANILADSEFREMLGVSDTDEDYNKMLAHVAKKGIAADKLNYSKGLDSFKEQLYNVTNQGIEVNIDKQVEEFRASGRPLTAQDEHKLRKSFKSENSILVKSESYIENITRKSGAFDESAGKTNKEQQALYDRSFTSILKLTGDTFSIDDISAQLGNTEIQHQFGEYIHGGGKIPDTVKDMFTEPSGIGAEKWSKANDAIVTLEAVASGSGQSVEQILGAAQVGKIRGLARLHADESMDAGVKQAAIEALNSAATTFNSRGQLTSTEDTKVDKEWLDDVSKDADWTTEDFVSNVQNGQEIAHNFYSFKLAGMSDSKAKESALSLFKSSNKSFEMPNRDEITIPKEHQFLNNESIKAFAKDASRFPEIQKFRQAEAANAFTGDSWFTEWDTNNEISIQKTHSFAKTGKYEMMLDGMPQGSFTYDEMRDFIGNSPAPVRKKITGMKEEMSFAEAEAKGDADRAKNIKKRQSVEQFDFINDLSVLP